MEKEYPQYSVLMSVYIKEKPENLRNAIQSMIDQSVLTNDFVIVCDGPLTQELDSVIESFVNTYQNKFQILRLTENQGLGNALNAGLGFCRNELVARMDSDDISLPYRCESQLMRFMKHPDLALCSGDIAEFDSDPAESHVIRHVPETYEEILRFAKRRNPMNHMAVMYKKSAVKSAGGYIEIKLAEDYYLWVRMLQKGYYAENINQVLVKARVGNGMYARRGGWEYAKNSCILQKKFLQIHFISFLEFILNCITRMLGSLIPTYLRRMIYQCKLRKVTY